MQKSILFQGKISGSERFPPSADRDTSPCLVDRPELTKDNLRLTSGRNLVADVAEPTQRIHELRLGLLREALFRAGDLLVVGPWSRRGTKRGSRFRPS